MKIRKEMLLDDLRAGLRIHAKAVEDSRVECREKTCAYLSETLEKIEANPNWSPDEMECENPVSSILEKIGLPPVSMSGIGLRLEMRKDETDRFRLIIRRLELVKDEFPEMGNEEFSAIMELLELPEIMSLKRDAEQYDKDAPTSEDDGNGKTDAKKKK